MLGDIWTMVILYTSMNLPPAVRMTRSFLLEVPREVLEAGGVDGARLVAGRVARNKLVRGLSMGAVT